MQRRTTPQWREGMSRRELLRRLGLGGAAAVVLPIVGAACGSGDGGQPSDSGTTTIDSTGAAATVAGDGGTEIESLTWALGSSVASLSTLKTDAANAAVLSLGLEGLLVLDETGALRPHLAESWEQPDPLTYIYTLRDGVRFWDGSGLTAEDVAYSMSQHLDTSLGSTQGYYFSFVESIEATAPNVVTVKMKQPDLKFAFVPAAMGGYVVSKAFLETHGKSVGTPDVLTMGTGPYRVTEFTPDESVEFVRNEDYWGGMPIAKSITISTIMDDSTRQLAVRSGEVDGTFTLNLQQISQWDRIEEAVVGTAPGARTFFLGFDLDHEPWSDLDVRTAIAHCIDKPGLANAVFSGRAVEASCVNAPTQWSDVPAELVEELYGSLPTYEFDLAKAAAALERSSFAGGFEATVNTPVTVPEIGKILENLAENAEKIGIQLAVKEVHEDAWLNTFYTHKDLGLQAIDFIAYIPDMGDYADALLASAGAAENGWNFANYRNAEVDALLAEQAETIDPVARFELVKRIFTTSAAELPYLPLFWAEDVVAHRNSLSYPTFSHWYFVQRWPEDLVPEHLIPAG